MCVQFSRPRAIIAQLFVMGGAVVSHRSVAKPFSRGAAPSIHPHDRGQQQSPRCLYEFVRCLKHNHSRQLAAGPPTIPTRTGWYLADLGEAKGRFKISSRQSPQKLKVLREHALIESAVSSNRIEGVEVDQSRVATLMFGKPALRDRDEEEMRGYRDALRLIHESGAKLPISEAP